MLGGVGAVGLRLVVAGVAEEEEEEEEEVVVVVEEMTLAVEAGVVVMIWVVAEVVEGATNTTTLSTSREQHPNPFLIPASTRTHRSRHRENRPAPRRPDAVERPGNQILAARIDARVHGPELPNRDPMGAGEDIAGGPRFRCGVFVQGSACAACGLSGWVSGVEGGWGLEIL